MKTKLAIVCFPSLGGSGVVATELGKSLATRGNEVHFIAERVPSRLNHFDENIFFHKVEPGDYPLFQHLTHYPLSLAVKIREVVDHYDLDLVHVHYAIPYATCAFLAKEMLKPRPVHTVTTLHGTDITLVGQMPSFYEITRFSISVSDAITAVSNFLKKETIRAFGIREPIEVIHNFVEASEFKPEIDPEIRSRLAPSGEKLIVHASNFRKVKNIPTVLEVFARVRSELPCRLVLIGDGPEREAAERQAVKLDIQDDVVFMGDQEFVAELFPAGDVFLLPSEHESFGLAALEAMSCQVPVVASDVGGLHEVIEHEKTGYLCCPNDVNCMSGIIMNLLRDDDKRREMGKLARHTAVSKFNKDKIVKQYQALYNRLLER